MPVCRKVPESAGIFFYVGSTGKVITVIRYIIMNTGINNATRDDVPA